MYHCDCASDIYYSLSHGAWTGVHSHNSPSLNHRAGINRNKWVNQESHCYPGNIYIAAQILLTVLKWCPIVPHLLPSQAPDYLVYKTFSNKEYNFICDYNINNEVSQPSRSKLMVGITYICTWQITHFSKFTLLIFLFRVEKSHFSLKWVLKFSLLFLLYKFCSTPE